MKTESIFLMLFLIVNISLNANIINVPTDINSIQGGINLAIDGDTVLVYPGIYIENINFNGKNIVLGSLMLTTGDTSYIRQTVIDGSQPNDPHYGSTVYLESGENSTTVLNGFTITGGTGTGATGSQALGGGILLDNGSCPNLLNLIVTGNIAESANGAGICCWNNNNGIIENVIVTGNDGSGNVRTGDGTGGILLANSSPLIRNVKIFNNTGLMAGGLFCNDNSNPVLINVTNSGNKANSPVPNDVAGLICWQNSHPILINTISWNNTSVEISVKDEYSSITLLHSDIQFGENNIANNNGTINWLNGNIDLYPMFIDSANGNYGLQTGSPCIDAGIQDTMFIYNNGLDTLIIQPMTYNGNAPDMGAYESPYVNLIVENNSNPQIFDLNQNYPNPFNPSTTIEFSLPKSEFVTLKIYNLLGQEVTTLVTEKLKSGKYQYTWDAGSLSSGIYLYSLQTSEYLETRKMILIR